MFSGAAWLVALLGVAASTVPGEVLTSKDGVLLPSSEASAFLHQCSRSSPQGFQGTWTPGEAVLRELEARLPAALHAEWRRHSDRFRKYAARPTVRQYAGMVLHGRNIIYVNALPRSMVANPALPLPYTPDWRNKADVVCDGGPVFFGVEYDPVSKTFSHFAFNGPV